MKVQTLGNMYEMLCESFMMYGVELCGFDTEWKETKKKIYGRFCKKVLRLPKCTGNGMAGMKLGRDSRKGKVI
jgi:hypothetical protein